VVAEEIYEDKAMLARRIKLNDQAGIKDPTSVNNRKRTAYIHGGSTDVQFLKERQLHPSCDLSKPEFD